MEQDKQICVLCNYEFMGWGNNAEPLAVGQCCDGCNIFVVNERMRRLERVKGL